MRAWILYLGLLTFGVIWILMGVAATDSEPYVRRGFCLVGGLFLVVSFLGLFFGTGKQTIPPFETKDRTIELGLGVVMGAFAAIGVIYVAIAQPTLEENSAPWTTWVLFAALLWFFAAGVFLIKHSRMR